MKLSRIQRTLKRLKKGERFSLMSWVGPRKGSCRGTIRARERDKRFSWEASFKNPVRSQKRCLGTLYGGWVNAHRGLQTAGQKTTEVWTDRGDLGTTRDSRKKASSSPAPEEAARGGVQQKDFPTRRAEVEIVREKRKRRGLDANRRLK